MGEDAPMHPALNGRKTQARTLARWWAAGHRVNPLAIDHGAVRTRWYHDFAPFGLPTPQLPGIYEPNQASKMPTLFNYIDRAIGDLPDGAERSVLELFCADGFYSVRAALAGANAVRGVDLDEDNLRKARLIADVLGLDQMRFDAADVFDVDDQVDVAICAGGLYHVSDPAGLVQQLRGQVRHHLVVQTVIHNGIEDRDYFETPAPGWTWGSRFSEAWLHAAVRAAGWEILEASRGELTGNDRPEDRGSAFLLCRPGMSSAAT